MTPLQQAIYEARGQGNLAVQIGVRPQAISYYIRKGEPPLDRCPAIEAATGVRCEALRPDVEWLRDEAGAVTGYITKVEQAAA